MFEKLSKIVGIAKGKVKGLGENLFKDKKAAKIVEDANFRKILAFELVKMRENEINKKLSELGEYKMQSFQRVLGYVVKELGNARSEVKGFEEQLKMSDLKSFTEEIKSPDSVTNLNIVLSSESKLALRVGAAAATGGIGMAGGLMAFAGLVVAPAFAYYLIKKAQEGEKALTLAEEYRSKCEVEVEEYLGTNLLVFDAFDQNTNEIQINMNKLLYLFEKQKNINENLKKYSSGMYKIYANLRGDEFKNKINTERRVVTVNLAVLSKLLKTVITTPILEKDGAPIPNFKITYQGESKVESLNGRYDSDIKVKSKINFSEVTELKLTDKSYLDKVRDIRIKCNVCDTLLELNEIHCGGCGATRDGIVNSKYKSNNRILKIAYLIIFSGLVYYSYSIYQSGNNINGETPDALGTAAASLSDTAAAANAVAGSGSLEASESNDDQVMTAAEAVEEVRLALEQSQGIGERSYRTIEDYVAVNSEGTNIQNSKDDSSEVGQNHLSIRNSSSFNCNNALTRPDEMICASKELSSADYELFKAYKYAASNSSIKDEVELSQKNWLKFERDVCVDIECLLVTYKKRIIALKTIAKNGEGNVDFVTVPNIKGECGNVEQIIKRAGLVPKLISVHGPDDEDAAEPGCAYRQNPPAGTNAPKGSVVTFRSWWEAG